MLDYFCPRKQFSGRFLSGSIGFTRISVNHFLSKTRPVFPSLKRHLDSAVCLLKEGNYFEIEFTGQVANNFIFL